MDWISGIQRAVDYVEAHITEPIDYEEVARQAYSSNFHFQRVFSILCGYTLGDYIRMRRLSLAGNELTSSDSKVIDVAMKYGYDSSESFSRAFTKFHGATPTNAKHGGAQLKSFSPLSVKLTLDGGSTIKYRIETMESFQIICKGKRVFSKDKMPTEEIAQFWANCQKDGTIDSLLKYIPENNIFGNSIVGASFGNDATEKDFPYAIGVHYNGLPVIDKDLTVEEIPAHTYMVFSCVGKMPEAFVDLYQKIFSEFFLVSEYQPCYGIDFEVYPSDDVFNPAYTCEIWVAVEKKISNKQ